MKEITDDVFNLEKIFPEPFKVFEKDKTTLNEAKENAIIVLDTNILLFPYTVSTHSLTSIKIIYKKLIDKDRLFIPNQVAREFAKNRNKKLGEMYHSILNSTNKFNKSKKYPILKDLDEYKELLKFEIEVESKFSDYNDQIKKLAQAIKNMERNDPVSLIYYDLFKKESIVNHDKENDDIKKDLEFRTKNNIPPGYKDKSKDDFGIGDLIIWHTILSLGTKQKKNLIFVSNDEKGDWYNQANGNAFQPRYELIDEYKRISNGNTIHIVNFSSFLNLFDIDKDASSEIEDKENYNTYTYKKISGNFNSQYEDKKEEIKEWVYENYGDPAELLPYDSKEGGYIEIFGNIVTTEEMISENFCDDIPKSMIDEIVSELESEKGCDFWSPKPDEEYYEGISSSDEF